jgi:hypothetical protein
MKQTAVDWLQQALEDTILTHEQIMQTIGLFEQAKEMEKEQMVDFAFKYGDLTTRQIADSFDKEYKTNEK